MLTGVVGGATAQPRLAGFRIYKDATIGCASRIVAHRVHTSRAYQVSLQAGAEAGQAMTLARLATGLLLPNSLALMAGDVPNRHCTTMLTTVSKIPMKIAVPIKPAMIT